MTDMILTTKVKPMVTLAVQVTAGIMIVMISCLSKSKSKKIQDALQVALRLLVLLVPTLTFYQ